MSEARVHGAVSLTGAVQSALAGRLLGNSLQTRLDELCDEDSELCCPVTLMLFKDPVIASDGFMYEADSVKQLIRNHHVSPCTREQLKKEYFPAKQKKSEVTTFREKRTKDLLQFAKDASPSDMRMAAMALDRVMEYPALARETCALWEKTGRPLPAELRPFSSNSRR